MNSYLLKYLMNLLSFRTQTNTNYTLTSLTALHLKIRLVIWFLTFLYVVIAPLTSKYRFPLVEFYVVCIPGWLLYLYLIFKCKNDFIVGLPSLLTALIVSDNALHKSDYYMRMLASCMGIISVYSVQGFPFQLIFLLGLGYIGLQQRYLPQLTRFHEPITSSYSIPEHIVEDFLRGWNRTLILMVLCLMIYQAITQRVWNFSQNVQKNLEDTNQKLQQANEKLEKTVQELAYSNNQLKQALESQDLFVACVSHELRNPLNVMLGSLDLLESQVKDVSQLQTLKTCKICGDALLNQINNLLDVAKINSDKLEISEFSTKMSTFLDKFWVYTKIGMDRKALQGQLVVDKSLPLWLNIDSLRLQQILNNLVGNAVKFTTEGSVRIKVCWSKDFYSSKLNLIQRDSQRISALNGSRQAVNTHFEENFDEVLEGEKTQQVYSSLSSPKRTFIADLDSMISFKAEDSVKSRLEEMLSMGNMREHGFLRIDIVDTGCGITEEAQAQIFEPFVQADRSITRKYGGTGLGLYIVKKLIEKMGGEIRLSSKKDQGTLFQIILPVKGIKKDEGTQALITNMASSTEVIQSNLDRQLEVNSKTRSKSMIVSKRSVLIVDDDKFNQNIMTKYFQSLGFECDVASDGLEGFNTYKKNRGKYYLITMDIQMPVLDGISACKMIRAYEREAGQKSVDIVIVTGNCSEGEYKECLREGEIQANYFFRKPFRLSDCKLCVQKIMSSSMKV